MKHETYKLEIILKRSKKLHWHSSWPQQVPSLEKLLFKWESFPFTGLTLMMKWRLKSRKKELAKRLFFTGNSERRRFGKFPFYEEKKGQKRRSSLSFFHLGKKDVRTLMWASPVLLLLYRTRQGSKSGDDWRGLCLATFCYYRVCLGAGLCTWVFSKKFLSGVFSVFGSFYLRDENG